MIAPLPYHDTPDCPKCKGPVIVTANHPEPFRYGERLACILCDYEFPGSEAEYQQAIRAEDAWEIEQQKRGAK